MEAGHSKQDTANYLISCANFIFYHYEQHLYVYHAGFQGDFDSIYDRIWRDHGRADRFTTVSR